MAYFVRGFFLALLVVSGPVLAQEDYRGLWRRGAYAEALEALKVQFEQYRSPVLRRDCAELLFTLGRVDEAIEHLEILADEYVTPMTAVRLAEMYRYCGRLAECAEAVRTAEHHVRLLTEYRPGGEELLATGRLMELKGEDPGAVLLHYTQVARAFPGDAGVLTAAGDVALRRRGYDVAARKYSQALELDAGNQDALAGLARCYAGSGDARTTEVIEKLLAHNPHHPDAHILQAERLLDAGEAEAALGALAEVLAVNPNHLEALALQAAGRFLQDDHAGLAAVQELALAFNPHDSGVYRVAGRVASRHYRFEAGRRLQEQALEVDAEDVEARLLLAFDLLRLGEDARARAELERAFAEDPYSVRAYNLLGAADAIDAFRTVERGIFRLQLPGPEAEVLSEEMLGLLSEAAAFYQARYRVALETPVVVQMFDDHDVFMVRSVGLPGNAGHLGICFGRLVTMDSPRARPPATVNWRQVLWHEFVHVVTLQKTRNRMPRWLSEGISVYEETTRDAAWGQKLDAQFKPVVDAGGYPGVSDLERFFTAPESPEHLMFGYFASGAFVAWYTETYGTDALADALAQIGAGEEALDALAAACGETGLDVRFRAYIAGRCAALGQLEAGSAFREALAAGDRAARGGDLPEAARAYLEAFGLYPDYAAADAPLRRLVGLYADGGDADRYRAALERLVAWDPTAYEACISLGALLAERGDWAGAGRALDRAFGIHPFDASLYRQRAQVRQARGDWDGAASDLRRLMALDAPGRAGYRLELARTLLQKGDRTAAKAEALGLLEDLPHFWDAQALLLEIVEGP